jgi:hypothetical protein
MRPDIHFDDETKKKLLIHLHGWRNITLRKK